MELIDRIRSTIPGAYASVLATLSSPARRHCCRRCHGCQLPTSNAGRLDVTLSSDFISGFCDETAGEHADSLSLVQTVRYDMAYLFAYSMRNKVWLAWEGVQKIGLV